MVPGEQSWRNSQQHHVATHEQPDLSSVLAFAHSAPNIAASGLPGHESASRGSETQILFEPEPVALL